MISLAVRLGAMRLLFEDGTVTVRTISKEEGDPFGGKDEEL